MVTDKHKSFGTLKVIVVSESLSRVEGLENLDDFVANQANAVQEVGMVEG